MSKYLVNHQNVSPENFEPSDVSHRKVKALLLPADGLPQVLYDEPQVLKQKCFVSLEHMHFLPLHPYFHMYVDQVDQVQHKSTNVCATYVYRHSLQTYIGINTVVTINGNALLFGSVSSMDQDNYHVDYSVPYELIEQIARYYDHGIIK
jgi:hypothetical protein